MKHIFENVYTKAANDRRLSTNEEYAGARRSILKQSMPMRTWRKSEWVDMTNARFNYRVGLTRSLKTAVA